MNLAVKSLERQDSGTPPGKVCRQRVIDRDNGELLSDDIFLKQRILTLSIEDTEKRRRLLIVDIGKGELQTICIQYAECEA